MIPPLKAIWYKQAGQVTDLIHDEPTVAELMGRIVAQAKAQQQKINAQFS